jgi:hypothetical protein
VISQGAEPASIGVGIEPLRPFAFPAGAYASGSILPSTCFPVTCAAMGNPSRTRGE